MQTFRRWGWPLITTLLMVGAGYKAADVLGDLRTAPTAPTPLTLAQLQQLPTLPRWIELHDVVVRCDLTQRVNKSYDAVAVVDVNDTASDPRALYITLEKDQLCATIATPLQISVRNSAAFRARVMEDLRSSGAPIGNTTFSITRDLPGSRRNDLIGFTVALFAAVFALLFQLKSRVDRRRHVGLRAVGGAGAAPAGGVLAAIVSGSRVDAVESVFPPAPLVVSVAAERSAFRQKYIGPAILVVSSVAMMALGGYATVGVVNDLRAWHQGIEVPAELKGSTTTKLILSFLHIELAWQMPGESTPRHDSRWFMTLWMPDEDAGAVRALADDPSVATFEEAVDLIPLRAPLILGLFAFAVGALFSARKQRKTADRVQLIADTAVEGRLVDPSIVTQTTNGAVTGHTLSGTLDGLPVSMVLAANTFIGGLVVADSTGDLLVAKSIDGAVWTPILADGEPFAWRGADLARAQAILIARGSPSVLFEPALG